jgi:hypothetical protein
MNVSDVILRFTVLMAAAVMECWINGMNGHHGDQRAKMRHVDFSREPRELDEQFSLPSARVPD